jgi:hypothetical protein
MIFGNLAALAASRGSRVFALLAKPRGYWVPENEPREAARFSTVHEKDKSSLLGKRFRKLAARGFSRLSQPQTSPRGTQIGGRRGAALGTMAKISTPTYLSPGGRSDEHKGAALLVNAGT